MFSVISSFSLSFFSDITIFMLKSLTSVGSSKAEHGDRLHGFMVSYGYVYTLLYIMSATSAIHSNIFLVVVR